MKPNKSSYSYICDNCGISFTKTDKRKYKYCSNDCRYEMRGKREKINIINLRSEIKKMFSDLTKSNQKVYDAMMRDLNGFFNIRGEKK